MGRTRSFRRGGGSSNTFGKPKTGQIPPRSRSLRNVHWGQNQQWEFNPPPPPRGYPRRGGQCRGRGGSGRFSGFGARRGRSPAVSTRICAGAAVWHASVQHASATAHAGKFGTAQHPATTVSAAVPNNSVPVEITSHVCFPIHV